MYISDNKENIRTSQIEETFMVTQGSDQGKSYHFLCSNNKK